MGSDFQHVGLGSPNVNLLHLALTGGTAGAFSVAKSTVAAYPPTVVADGQTQAGVVVSLLDANGNSLTTSGGREISVPFTIPGERVRIRLPEAERVRSATLVEVLRPSFFPIVFAQVTDPVGEGLVASLSRPGGNITGFSAYDSEMGGKWMELLKEFAPGVTRAALLFNPRTSPGGAPS